MSNPTMVIETVFTQGVAHHFYVIGDRGTGKSAVIDPRRDVDEYIELARKHKLSITHVSGAHPPQTHSDESLNIFADLVAAAGRSPYCARSVRRVVVSEGNLIQ